MQICFICNEYPPGNHGGIGTFTQVLARRLVAAGHEVRVIGMYASECVSEEYSEDEGVRVWRLKANGTRLGWIPNRYRLYRRIAQWSRAGEIDLVEAPDWQGWIALWPRLPVPVVIRLNGSASYFARELGRDLKKTAFWIERAAFRRADGWCSVSRYTAVKTKEIFQLESGPSAILHNAVERPARAIKQARNSTDIVFTGTLTKKKGILSLIKAWPDVLRRCPDAKLHIYGRDGRTDDGRSMREHIETQLNGNLGTNVWLHGHVSRDVLFKHFETARAAIFPSYSEAFGLAPVEAMIRGCPTIFSTLSTGPELIEDASHGLLVHPDSINDIASAMCQILEDDSLATQLGEGGARQAANNFSDDCLCARNETFFRESIEQFAAKQAMVPRFQFWSSGRRNVVPVVESKGTAR